MIVVLLEVSTESLSVCLDRCSLGVFSDYGVISTSTMNSAGLVSTEFLGITTIDL